MFLLQILLLPPPQALGESTRRADLKTSARFSRRRDSLWKRKELAWKEASEKGSILPGSSAAMGLDLEEGLDIFGVFVNIL